MFCGLRASRRAWGPGELQGLGGFLRPSSVPGPEVQGAPAAALTAFGGPVGHSPRVHTPPVVAGVPGPRGVGRTWRLPAPHAALSPQGQARIQPLWPPLHTHREALARLPVHSAPGQAVGGQDRVAAWLQTPTSHECTSADRTMTLVPLPPPHDRGAPGHLHPPFPHFRGAPVSSAWAPRLPGRGRGVSGLQGRGGAAGCPGPATELAAAGTGAARPRGTRLRPRGLGRHWLRGSG